MRQGKHALLAVIILLIAVGTALSQAAPSLLRLWQISPVGATTGKAITFNGTALTWAYPNVQAVNVLDATTAGRSMLTAADAAAQTALLNPVTTTLKGVLPAPGAGNTPLCFKGSAAWGTCVDTTANYAFTGTVSVGGQNVVVTNDTRLSDARTPLAHTHPTTQISDSTAAGRAMLTATDAAAQTALLSTCTSSTKGLVPAGGSGSTSLRGDCTWGPLTASPAGSSGQVQYNNGGAAGGAGNVSISSSGDLQINPNASPATPASGQMTLTGRAVANRVFPAWYDSGGEVRSVQSLMARNKVAFWNAPGGSATVPGVFGLAAGTAVGTATARTVATTNAATRQHRIGYVSAATAGSLAELRWGQAVWTAGSGSADGSGFFYVSRFVPSDAAAVSGARGFVGLMNSTTAATNVEPSSCTQCIGVAQLSTDATQWYVVSGGTAAQTATALGTALGAPNTSSADVFELAIYAPTTPANTFYLQLTNVRTKVSSSVITLSGGAAVVPQSTTLLAPRFWRTNNATAAAVAFDVISLYLETDL